MPQLTLNKYSLTNLSPTCRLLTATLATHSYTGLGHRWATPSVNYLQPAILRGDGPRPIPNPVTAGNSVRF